MHHVFRQKKAGWFRRRRLPEVYRLPRSWIIRGERDRTVWRNLWERSDSQEPDGIAMAVTKEGILAAIERAAAERGGRIGLAASLEETGIPEKQILGKHWATWNEALSEAGVKTASFAKPRTPEETVLEALSQFVVRLGKWPTENQLSLERRRNRAFPSLGVFRRMLRA